jgi:dUTP pyrophosphatase
MIIKFKKLVPEAQTPLKVIDIDAGFDLYATSINETSNYIEYLTGIAVEIPEGYVGLVFPRSSVTKYDLMLKNCVGVIDASYRGEIRCRFHETNLSKHGMMGEPTRFYDGNIYKVGDRVAQIVFLELPKVTLVQVEELSDTVRGSGGFGHTGK